MRYTAWWLVGGHPLAVTPSTPQCAVSPWPFLRAPSKALTCNKATNTLQLPHLLTWTAADTVLSSMMQLLVYLADSQKHGLRTKLVTRNRALHDQ